MTPDDGRRLNPRGRARVGKLPEESEMSGIQQANEALYRGLGLSSEDLARGLEKAAAGTPPQEPLTPEKAVDVTRAEDDAGGDAREE